MTKESATGNWTEYRRLVLSELQRLSQVATAMEAALVNVRSDIAHMKTLTGALGEQFEEHSEKVDSLTTRFAVQEGNVTALQATTGKLEEGVSDIKGKAAAISGTVGAAIAGIATLVKALTSTGGAGS